MKIGLLNLETHLKNVSWERYCRGADYQALICLAQDAQQIKSVMQELVAIKQQLKCYLLTSIVNHRLRQELLRLGCRLVLVPVYQKNYVLELKQIYQCIVEEWQLEHCMNLNPVHPLAQCPLLHIEVLGHNGQGFEGHIQHYDQQFLFLRVGNEFEVVQYQRIFLEFKLQSGDKSFGLESDGFVMDLRQMNDGYWQLKVKLIQGMSAFLKLACVINQKQQRKVNSFYLLAQGM